MSPLEIPLETRNEIESLGAKSELKGGWERTSNFSVSRASIVARAACGLALSCSNKICDVDRLTRHTLRRRFFYCFNVLSWIDSIPSHRTLLQSRWHTTITRLHANTHCFRTGVEKGMKLCTAVQEGCGYKDTLRARRYFAMLAKYFTVCITYQPPLCVCMCVCVRVCARARACVTNAITWLRSCSHG